MRLLIKNARIINHNEEIHGNILIENHLIKEISNSEPEADKVIDAAGLTVVPGFIDMHVHFRDPGQTGGEDVITGGKAAAAGGITTACCMANTKPVNDNISIVEHIVNKSKLYSPIDVLPICAVTKGFLEEELTDFGLLLKAGACAFSDDGKNITNTIAMRSALEHSKQFDAIIIAHAEDNSLAGKGCCNEGTNSTKAGLIGIPDEAEEVVVARDIVLSEKTGGRLHVAHISTAGTVKLIREAKEKGINVTCEVTPHHFTLNDENILTYDTSYKMNPPLRTQEDIDEIKKGLQDGTIDAIATDHAPHSPSKKSVEFEVAPFGIIGLQTSIPLTLQLVKDGVISLQKMVELCSYRPAQILNLHKKGEIKAGNRADITIIDENREYVFDSEINQSKSINSPYFGKRLTGIAAYTIKDGEVVWEI